MEPITQSNVVNKGNINVIKKREGDLVPFDPERIKNAIVSALLDSSEELSYEQKLAAAEKLTSMVVAELQKDPTKEYSVEDIQDIVQIVLVQNRYVKALTAFYTYRETKNQLRQDKMKILNTKVLDRLSKKLEKNQLTVIADRYLLKDKDKKPRELPADFMKRVATTLALVDLVHDESIYNNRKDAQKNLKYPFQDNYMRYYVDINEQLFNKYAATFHKYGLNEHHVERLVYMLIDAWRSGCVDIAKIVWYKSGEKEGQKALVVFKDLLKDLLEKYFGEGNEYVNRYYTAMSECKLMLNTPALMNFGRPLGGGNACFVLKMEDDLKAIGDTNTRIMQIYKKAGGVGINVSNIREEGSQVADIPDGATGPISWLELVDYITQKIKAGTGRRGANMGILNYDHPDIEKFITFKNKDGNLENFNISVGLWAEFFDYLKFKNDSNYPLISRYDGSIKGYVNARKLWNMIAYSAWKSAEPGVLFFDNANAYNTLKELRGPVDATNPCGEQYLYPNDSCTLGSINLEKFVTNDGQFDWDDYKDHIKLLTHMLDNVLSVSRYPDGQIEQETKNMRRVGSGIMGLANALVLMRIKYNSEQGYKTMGLICKRLQEASIEESTELAQTRGTCFWWDELVKFEPHKTKEGLVRDRVEGRLDLKKETIDSIEQYGMRNMETTTIAPTGTISMITDTSTGLEPIFAIAYEKRTRTKNYRYVNELFIKDLKKAGIYSEELLQKVINNYASCQGIEEIPQWMQDCYIGAVDMHYLDHLRAQRECGLYIGNSISKTINMPNDATPEDVKNAYYIAHLWGLKGVSIYRDGSRSEQIIYIEGNSTPRKLEPSKYAMTKLVNSLGEDQYGKEQLAGLIAPGQPRVITINLSGSEIAAMPITMDPLQHDQQDSEKQQKLVECPNCKNSAMVPQDACMLCLNCGYSPCSK